MMSKAKVSISVILSLALALGMCPVAYADQAQRDAGEPVSGTQQGLEDEKSSSEAFVEDSDGDAGSTPSKDGANEEGVATDGTSNDTVQEEAPAVESDDNAGVDAVQNDETLSAAAPQSLESPSKGEAAPEKEKSQDLPDGDYLIVSSLRGDRILDVQYGSRNNSAPVQTYSYNNTGAQKWRVSHDKDGYLIIKNIGSGKVLDARGASTRNGTQVQQYASNNSKAQRWIATKNSNGTFTIASAMNAKKVIDISGASTAIGAKVQLYDKNGSKAQQFTFKSLNPKVDPCEKLIEDGYYEITSSLNDGFVLDVSGASLANGANVQLYKRNGSLAQLFKFTYSDGYYKVQAASGKYLDVAAAGLMNGTNIQQYAGNKSNAQLWSVRKNSDGSFSFISKTNALAIDVRGGKAANGTNIQCYAPSKTKAQKFKLKKKTNLVKNGTYTIRPAISTNRVLDVKAASTGNGANVQLYSSNGSQAQKWVVSLVSGQTNVYTLRSVRSGKYLAMDSNGNVCQRKKATDGSQYWKASVSAGKIAFTNVKRNKALDISGGSNRDGANVQGYKWNSTNAQRFVLSSTTVLGNGTYVIRSAAAGSQVLDVVSGSRNNKANVQVYKSNNSGAQKWTISRNSDGTYRIINAQSGKALDINGGVAKGGNNVQQYQWNSSKAQKWRIADNGDGTFKVVSALSDKLVLAVSGTPKNGANVQIATDTGAANQRFTFDSTSYSPYAGDQQAMLNKANGYSSSTNYLILVDCKKNKVAIFRGSKGNWNYVQYWPCTTGAPSSPTKKGIFKVGSRGTSFGSGYTCWYWTQFSGNYLFHSVLYNPGSKISIQDGRLGMNLSHGCVRLDIANARWIYNTIPSNTTVVVY